MLLSGNYFECASGVITRMGLSDISKPVSDPAHRHGYPVKMAALGLSCEYLFEFPFAFQVKSTDQAENHISIPRSLDLEHLHSHV